jgi:single-strand DNA-binding protein
MATEAAAGPADSQVRNEVVLAGRLAAPGEERTLPSGDLLVTFRLVVARPQAARVPGRPTVDTIDCTAWGAAVRRSVLGWNAGDVVEVTGALRRRFWRGGSGATSRTEVEAVRAKRLAKAS